MTAENLGNQKKAKGIDFKYLPVELERDIFQATAFILLTGGLIDTGIVHQNGRHPKNIQAFLAAGF
jgi:hypothetical protein